MDSGHRGNLKLHLGLIFAEIICVSAFVIELLRATSGNELSWAYVFEWPFFAGYAIYMWRKLLNDETRQTLSTEDPSETASDEALAIYNEYLRNAHHRASDDRRAP
jgi:hypothetical protein